MSVSADEERHVAAVALLAGGEASFRATARRVSICEADAEDAFQRSVEILLTKAPPGADRGRLAAWMHVVTRREALALRRGRLRLLSEAASVPADDALAGMASERPGPEERLADRESARGGLALLARLRPDQRRALVLKAHGYSYAEIGRICGWTYTKVNRSLAEGRARLRQLGAGC